MANVENEFFSFGDAQQPVKLACFPKVLTTDHSAVCEYISKLLPLLASPALDTVTQNDMKQIRIINIFNLNLSC